MGWCSNDSTWMGILRVVERADAHPSRPLHLISPELGPPLRRL
ncbi:Hypothetical protein A7982_04051 [Minicystis rosea]|nr:Hypothetical protein A7982_04051 [Minicystis rosea]